MSTTNDTPDLMTFAMRKGNNNFVMNVEFGYEMDRHKRLSLLHTAVDALNKAAAKESVAMREFYEGFDHDLDEGGFDEHIDTPGQINHPDDPNREPE